MIRLSVRSIVVVVALTDTVRVVVILLSMARCFKGSASLTTQSWSGHGETQARDRYVGRVR